MSIDEDSDEEEEETDAGTGKDEPKIKSSSSKESWEDKKDSNYSQFTIKKSVDQSK